MIFIFAFKLLVNFGYCQKLSCCPFRIAIVGIGSRGPSTDPLEPKDNSSHLHVVEVDR